MYSRHRHTWIMGVLFFMVIMILTACSGGGGGGAPEPAGITLGDVTALYPENGSNWNDYLKNDGAERSSGTDTACDPATDGPGYDSCIHGGEMRVFEVTGKTGCAGLTAEDTLGAFEWICDDRTNPVMFISTGLQNGKYLSHLIDFSAAAWRQNRVMVYSNGTKYGATPASAWWSNPVVVNNDGGDLSNPLSIYLVTSSAHQNYTIAGDKVGLVIKPGMTLSGPGTGVNVISAIGHNFLWIEGRVNATNDKRGIYWDGVGFSMMHNVAADNAISMGVYITDSSSNTLSRMTASNNLQYGVGLSSSSNNTLLGIAASNNASDGVLLADSSNNALSSIIATNNKFNGVRLHDFSNNNTVAGITASNNGDDGISLSSSSDNNISTSITSSNNGYGGIFIDNSSNNTFSGITASNNWSLGIYLGNSSNNAFSGITASNNGHVGINLWISSNNTFTGLMKVGYNYSHDCFEYGGTNPGLTNDCENADAILTFGVTLAHSFVGKVMVNDTVNASDDNGVAAYPADPSTFEWSVFENPYRGWGIDGSDFPSADHRDQWTIGTGRIWDWSLAQGDTGDHGSPAVLDALGKPSGNDTLTHTWSDASTTTFLRYAVEAMGDEIGNDNLLCETDETCLYTPNIGSYQGHGSRIAAGYIGTGGTLENITLLKYENNGY